MINQAKLITLINGEILNGLKSITLNDYNEYDRQQVVIKEYQRKNADKLITISVSSIEDMEMKLNIARKGVYNVCIEHYASL